MVSQTDARAYPGMLILLVAVLSRHPLELQAAQKSDRVVSSTLHNRSKTDICFHASL